MLTPLERAVLDTMLDRPGEPFDTLRCQLAHASVSSREWTGVGFFTNFSLPPDAPVRRDLPDMEIEDVGAEIPGLQHGVGFILFIRDGCVSFLEGYTYDEPWRRSTDNCQVFRHAKKA